MTPRLLQEHEIDWALDLAQRAYRRQLGREAWGAWVSRALSHPSFRILRGDNSIVVACTQQMFPDFADIEGIFPYWFADEGHARELFTLFEHAIVWMREMKVSVVWLKPTTGIDATPIARYLGFTKTYPCFTMTLGSVN